MSAPQVRLSPDGQVAALRFEDHDGYPWAATDSGYYTDAQVASWTRLAPTTRQQDRSGARLLPARLLPEAIRYNQLWSRKDGGPDAERFLRITKVGVSRIEGYTWRAYESGGRTTRILKQAVVDKWTLVEDAPGGAA